MDGVTYNALFHIRLKGEAKIEEISDSKIHLGDTINLKAVVVGHNENRIVVKIKLDELECHEYHEKERYIRLNCEDAIKNKD